MTDAEAEADAHAVAALMLASGLASTAAAFFWRGGGAFGCFSATTGAAAGAGTEAVTGAGAAAGTGARMSGFRLRATTPSLAA